MISSLLAPLALAAPLEGRLTDPVHPTAQTVRLNIDPATDTYEGLVEITLQIDEKIPSFRLHAEDLEVQWASMGRKKLKPVDFSTESPFLTIEPTKPLKPGLITLEIAFKGTLGTEAAGLYKMMQNDLTYVITQFEANDARTAFPCFDEPAFKIPWTLEVTAPADLVTVGNMPIAEQTPNGAVRTVVFETSPPMPSYLVALAIGPYEATVVEGAAVPMTIYTPVGTSAQAAELADQFPKHLDALEAWFGRPLPYPKLDVVVVPEFAYGGMENVGMVVLHDRVLFDPATGTPAQRARIAEMVGHEIAHMWFGNLVTLRWWDDLWLNESFASWMGLKSRAEVLPNHPGEFSRVRRTYRAIRADGQGTMRPLRTEVDPSNVFESANFLAYPKGQAILGVTERWIGEETFQDGLRSYMDAHTFGNATSADLFSALSDASGDDIESILRPYLDTSGAPLLTFTRTDTGYTVRQERYTGLGSQASEDRIWPVPILYRTPEGSGRYLLEEAEGSFDVEGDWMLPVADGLGYFAWTFEDPAELQRLTAAAEELTTPEQIALLANLATLTTGGDLALDERLRLTQALAKHTSAPARILVIDTLTGVEDMVEPELGDAYSRWGTEVLAPVLADLGLEPRDDDTAHTAQLRGHLIGWLGEHGDVPSVIALRAAQTKAFLADPASADLEVAGPALIQHARGQDLQFQRRMLDHVESEESPRLRAVYLEAFASVQDPNARDRAMIWAMKPEHDIGDMFGVVFTLFDDRDAFGDIALDWAIDNHEAIMAKMPPQLRARMMGVGGGCDLARVERAKAFYLAPERAEPGVQRIAAEVEEQVKSCITRREAYGESLEAVLEPYR